MTQAPMAVLKITAWHWRCRVHSQLSPRYPTHAAALAAAHEHCHAYMPWRRPPGPTGRYA